MSTKIASILSFTAFRATSAGYRIARLFRANAKLSDRIFVDTGLTRGQIPLFMEVLHKPNRSQKELSRVLHIDAAAIARTLQTLESNGLVHRAENPECRRDKCVQPTSKGESLLPVLLATLDRHNEILFAGFAPEERKIALGLLDRFVANVEQALEKETR